MKSIDTVKTALTQMILAESKPRLAKEILDQFNKHDTNECVAPTLKEKLAESIAEYGIRIIIADTTAFAGFSVEQTDKDMIDSRNNLAQEVISTLLKMQGKLN